jgi:predicted nucleotidyltransferase
MREIEELKQQFIEQLWPVRIYLFGSYANDTFTKESDLDFYIMVSDKVQDIAAETAKAYKAVRRVKMHPVDIIVGTQSRFESRKHSPSIENEVYKKGILLYESGSEGMV